MKEKTCKDRTIIKPPGGGHIEKKAFLTLFWWENMISDMSSGF